MKKHSNKIAQHNSLLIFRNNVILKFIGANMVNFLVIYIDPFSEYTYKGNRNINSINSVSNRGLLLVLVLKNNISLRE